MLELITSPQAWLSLAVLTLMEVVLGIDNIVFITILCGRLPKERQLIGRRLGLAMALISRIVLLSTISWSSSWRRRSSCWWCPGAART